MSDIFDLSLEKSKNKYYPLAERMRPNNLEEFVGQNHFLGEGKLLNRLIKADRLTSMIFFGPPGTGKTTLAQIIAKTTKNNFYKISAVTAGIKDMKEIIKIAEDDLKIYKRKTILFIDEIHRFNKAQQDVLLPYVEKGIIILIGATTENPIFEVNKALLSRTRIIEFKSLEKSDLEILIDRTLKDKKNGYGNLDIEVESDAKNFLLDRVEGDARNLLNTLELAVLTTEKNENGKIVIDLDVISNCIQKSAIKYDKNGDAHYDVISAFIKSVRGSNPDAAIYYLAYMLNAGEDPKFIARRLIILSAEDIGLADPNAIVVATSAFEAINYIGMPEGRIPLAEATIYLCASKKSNSAYLAIDKALSYVNSNPSLEVPEYLKNIHINSKEKNFSYKYPHDYEDAIVKQDYLKNPENKFYEPKNIGYENKIAERLKYIEEKINEK